ncbi:MAG: ABC transporter permease [Hungatella sp.]|jgi:peptide/nickel transport system permease protein|nr:ABC transporter permease [Hungatella sp.]
MKKNVFLRDAVGRFVRHRVAMVSLIILVLEILSILLLPLILDLDPFTSYPGQFNQAPGNRFLFGTDAVGRDIFSRIIYGGRVSLSVGFIAASISALIGVPLGLIAGFYDNGVRGVIMRIVDIFMSFPALVIQMVLVTVLGASARSLMLVLGFLGWTGYTRLVYSKVLSVKQEVYVEAARSTGATNLTQMVRYILPNAMAPVFVTFSFAVAGNILAESGLSFLGLGVQLPTPTWGNMIRDAQTLSTLMYRPWMWIPAGVVLVATVVCINFVGDGLRAALDPKIKI